MLYVDQYCAALYALKLADGTYILQLDGILRNTLSPIPEDTVGGVVLLKWYSFIEVLSLKFVTFVTDEGTYKYSSDVLPFIEFSVVVVLGIVTSCKFVQL